MLKNSGNDLLRTRPDQQNVDPSAITEFVQALNSQIHEIHSFMLLRHGNVIAEGWWSPYKREYPHMLFSLSKSFTATAVGLALAEGRFSIDDPVLSFFPDETPREGNDLLAAMTVRHLLSMSTGHASDSWANMLERPDGDWIKGFFEVPVRHVPGSSFLYDTGSSYMLVAIVQKTSDMKLVDYLQPRLFDPLGIENATWQESPQGIALGGIGLSVKTEDIARFGQLYLQNGLWEGKRLLSEAWIAEATTVHMTTGGVSEDDWGQGYGYQFWRCRHGAYRGDGVFGQYCIVMPEQDAVLVITAGIDLLDSQQPLNLLWEKLLPAMGTDLLPDEDAAQDSLDRMLSSLSLPLVQGQAASPISSRVSGRTYKLDDNDLKVETVTLKFTESGCVASLKTAASEETISCGYDVWQHGQTTLFNRPWLFALTPVVASGAWTAEDSFTMVVRLYETPFFHTLVYHFVGDELLIELTVNVSFEPPTMLLTAHLI